MNKNEHVTVHKALGEHRRVSANTVSARTDLKDMIVFQNVQVCYPCRCGAGEGGEVARTGAHAQQFVLHVGPARRGGEGRGGRRDQLIAPPPLLIIPGFYGFWNAVAALAAVACLRDYKSIGLLKTSTLVVLR